MAFWIVDTLGSSTGDELWEIPDPTTPGTGTNHGTLPSGLTHLPQGIAFDAAGHAWIVDAMPATNCGRYRTRHYPGTGTNHGSLPSGLTSHRRAYHSMLLGTLGSSTMAATELWEIPDPTTHLVPAPITAPCQSGSRHRPAYHSTAAATLGSSTTSGGGRAVGDTRPDHPRHRHQSRDPCQPASRATERCISFDDCRARMDRRRYWRRRTVGDTGPGTPWHSGTNHGDLPAEPHRPAYSASIPSSPAKARPSKAKAHLVKPLA